MGNVRVRFAPSPTGALHIGGIRTALYNYLFAKKNNGTFILRIEDTDQARYVPGAESYIVDALNWLGLTPEEGPEIGGPFGPYRQSERKSIYFEYVKKLVASGHAYYAFDSHEEIEAMKIHLGGDQPHVVKYDFNTRQTMKNSLTLSEKETKELLDSGGHYVIRLKVPENESVHITDLIRGEVVFETVELDDKVLMKSDGMPTYHLANVVDDRLMKITHVIRGEEWLSSTAHHVLLYRAFGWESEMPKFSHLPLILKPTGNGKLSKRDGAQFGFPVFPLNWNADGESLIGFREYGFMPEALINFLAFLGWNPGTEQEIFSIDELISAFDIDKIGKSGARFDFEKAKWFNQQHLIRTEDPILVQEIIKEFGKHDNSISELQAQVILSLYKERVVLLKDFYTSGKYLVSDEWTPDLDYKEKKWKKEWLDFYQNLAELFSQIPEWDSPQIEPVLKNYILTNNFKMGEVMPALRVMISGISTGPDIYRMLEYKGQNQVVKCLKEHSKLLS